MAYGTLPNEQCPDLRAIASAQAHGSISERDRPQELGMLPRLVNDLLSVHNNMVRLRDRVTVLSGLIFGETPTLGPETKADCKPTQAPAPRLQELAEELTRDVDKLHMIVNRLEKLV
jgi:hypothetical protein